MNNKKSRNELLNENERKKRILFWKCSGKRRSGKENIMHAGWEIEKCREKNKQTLQEIRKINLKKKEKRGYEMDIGHHKCQEEGNDMAGWSLEMKTT